MNKKVALYVRVSTDKQSVDSQLHELQKFCESRNYEVFKIYSDVASGAKSQRPMLNELLEDARKNKFDIVCAYRFDRIARSSKMLIDLLTEFEHLGIDFISYNENVDTSSPLGKAMFTVIGAMAELERNIIRERVRAGVATAKSKGKRLGRPISRDDQKIAELRNQGFSIRKIASTLNTSIASVQRSIAHGVSKIESVS